MTTLYAIGRFLRGVPWQVYAAIGAALLIWLAVAWHGRAVEARVSAAYDQGVKDTSEAFVAAQAAADEAQRAKIAATAEKIDNSNREITNEHLASRDDIGARADALRVRAKAVDSQRATGASDMPGIPDASRSADEAACDGGLSLQDQITALEQAELNTRQLIDLQRSILTAATIWNQKDTPDDRARTTGSGEGDLLPAPRETVQR